MAKEGSVIAGLMDSFATSVSLSLQPPVRSAEAANRKVKKRFIGKMDFMWR